MSTDERVISRPIQSPRLEPIRSVRLDEEHPAPIGQEPRLEVSIPSLLWRLLLLAVGFGLALTGWMLVMSVFLVFIGFPLFFFGLAVMQAALPSLTDVA